MLRDKALIKVLIDAGGRGMCKRACQRCVAQPKGMPMLVSQARKRAKHCASGVSQGPEAKSHRHGHTREGGSSMEPR